MKFRKAVREDVPAIIEMIVDDDLGKLRENPQDPLPKEYYRAFESIDSNEDQELIVVEQEGKIIGTMQLTFLQYLTYQGGIRAQIEAVRIHRSQRGKGLGETFLQWAIDHAKERGVHLIQLTTDKKRPEALKFYEKLGFKASHEGMKLHFK
ncbi:MAG: GNAT family N-acetyltransferase [Reichenbachiella sp.]|uniref:GNAT family N-acetyltransferase n=1 Tax=Reichenbachiella sp. TaxID=2184521 RepID=UPI0032657BE7